MKRLFYSILILLMIPSLLMAQGLSLKSINDNLTTNYSTTTATQAWIASQGYLTAADLSSYALKADVYTTSEVDTLLNAKLNADVINGYYTAVTTDMFLSLKANSADVYTTGAVDLLLLSKLDASALIPYYTALQVDAKLLDYATTASVALKANSSDVYTTTAVNLLLADKADTGAVALKASQIQVDSEAVALQNHIGNFAAHGHNSPVGQPSNRLEVTDGAGGWQFTSVAAAGGGVTNAVDLNSSTASFSRLMNSLASNAQTALNQIDQNAATTAEVAAKANTADVYTKSETNDTIANAINAIPPPDFTNYYTKAQTNSTIENAIAAATASISLNQTITATAGENLTAGDVVSLINSYGTVTAKKNNLAVNTSPNGAESVFNSATTIYCSAVALDSTRFLVAYLDSSADPHAIVGTVSGSSIAWGSATSAFEAVGGGYVTACKIGTDKVLVCYRDSDAKKGRMVVLTISTAIITVGTPADYSTESPAYNSVTQLDTDKALVCYRCGISDTNGESKIITISSTTSTPNPASASRGTTFNAAATSYISCSALDSTHCLVAYQDGGGTAQVLSISGTDITPGAEYVFDSHTCFYNCTAALTSTTAIIGWENYQGYQRAVVATNASGTLSYGTPYISTDGFDSVKIYAINSSKAIAFFSDANDATNGAGKSAIFNINPTSITRDTAYKFNNAATIYIGGCYLANQSSIVVYADNGNSNYGTAVVNTWATPSYDSIRGLCTTTTASGNSAPILLSGEATGLSSLVTGSQYWLQSDFTMGTAPVSLAIMKNSSLQTGEIYLGTAKSSTEIIVGVDYK